MEILTSLDKDVFDVVVVDSSVWIANLRRVDCEVVRKLHALQPANEIIVGDLVLLEILQGARDDIHAARIEEYLRQFSIARMLNEKLARSAARYYRTLRQRAITVRKTIDLIIATFCIAGHHRLLHDDRDFLPFVEHFGLETI